MKARLVHSHYKIEGLEFELFVHADGNWFLVFGGIDQAPTQFTERQIQQIDQYVADWRRER